MDKVYIDGEEHLTHGERPIDVVSDLFNEKLEEAKRLADAHIELEDGKVIKVDFSYEYSIGFDTEESG